MLMKSFPSGNFPFEFFLYLFYLGAVNAVVVKPVVNIFFFFQVVNISLNKTPKITDDM